MLSSNYRDILRAMIDIHKTSHSIRSTATKKYNIQLALACSHQWVSQFPDETDAHFMLGFLMLIHGIDDEKVELIRDSAIHLDKCSELCKNCKSSKAFRQIRYYIGNGKGLHKVLQYDKDIVTTGMQTFSGRQVSDNKVAIEYASNSRAFTAFLQRDEAVVNRLKVDKERRLKCNIAVAKNKIYAKNISFEKVR